MNAAYSGPWMTGGLFDPVGTNFNAKRFRAVEVRPVTQDNDGCHAHIRGDGTRPHFWSVYLVDPEGVAECVADCGSERAADSIAEALMLEYSLGGRNTLRGPITSHDIAEAAQCLWEAVLDAVAGELQEPGSWQESAKLSCDNIGYSEVRDWMLQLAPACHAAWVRATEIEGYCECFDWHFVPNWLASLDWTDGQPVMRAEPAQPVAEPVAPVDVAEVAAAALEALVRAVASPARFSGDRVTADAGDDALNEALAAAKSVLSRIGVSIGHEG